MSNVSSVMSKHLTCSQDRKKKKKRFEFNRADCIYHPDLGVGRGGFKNIDYNMLPNLQEKMPITEEETNFEEIWKLLKKKKRRRLIVNDYLVSNIH